MDTTKVVIYVSEGSVQGIYSNNPYISLVIADTDLIDHGIPPVGNILSPHNTGDNLWEMFPEFDTKLIEVRNELKRLHF